MSLSRSDRDQYQGKRRLMPAFFFPGTSRCCRRGFSRELLLWPLPLRRQGEAGRGCPRLAPIPKAPLPSPPLPSQGRGSNARSSTLPHPPPFPAPPPPPHLSQTSAPPAPPGSPPPTPP